MRLATLAAAATCALLLLHPSRVSAQFGFEEEVEEYKGRLIGTFNSYHHQVNGEVYAVDDFTMLVKNFVYDGNGKDTFFWAGGSNRPGTQGFIVPNEDGRTNVLKRSVPSLGFLPMCLILKMQVSQRRDNDHSARPQKDHRHQVARRLRPHAARGVRRHLHPGGL